MEAEERFMKKAIELAKESFERRDHPVGAVVVSGNGIIGKGMTKVVQENDPTAHAEIVAIREACRNKDSRYLEGCILYSTHEPCPMCASAAVWAKMGGIVFGAYIQDSEGKARPNLSWRQIHLPCKEVLQKGIPQVGLIEGYLRGECVKLYEL